MKVLIYGLPGSGKSYLAEKLCEYLGDKVKWINADKVREEANDWDFSEEGRYRQKHRMKMLCEQAEAEGKIALADFVCPYVTAREEFNADYNIFVDAIDEGRFEDTNKIFERDKNYDYRIKNHNNMDAINLAWILGNLYIWDWKAPTTQMLGRFQPWHDGHQALFDRALAKHGQVFLMIRNMDTDDNNPYPAPDVASHLKRELVHYAGRLQIQVVPNIVNITYGRDVGYKIEQEHFDKSIEDISATKIRNEGKQT
jgi:hypothetical protein|tara:strand:+ start:1717 stop:2481 length:765 start_codon:yes stop_codon:yes gene_type:complete